MVITWQFFDKRSGKADYVFKTSHYMAITWAFP